MPDEPRERQGVAALLGYGLSDSSRMVDDYLRVTRRARRVVERLFY
jgi:glutamate-ammonia-ligase adenylyltransferase